MALSVPGRAFHAARSMVRASSESIRNTEAKIVMKLKLEHLSYSTLSAQATKASHTYHMLLYDFVTDMESKRGPTRGAHLEYLDDLV